MTGDDALAEISDELTSQTDLQPDVVHLVATKGAGVDGNEITLAFDADDSEDPVILGFDQATFDDAIVGRVVTASDRPYVEVDPEEARALRRLIDEGAWELPVHQRHLVEDFQERLPEAEDAE